MQLNDTHPALAVPELMRILLDEAKLGWDDAWDLTVRTLAYTNHTLLPEALEKWPVRLFELLLPRHLELIYEINRRFLDDVRAPPSRRRRPRRRVSLIEEGAERKVRMANLAIVGTHSTNGVAADSLRAARAHAWCPISAELFPERFNNKTNGVTPATLAAAGQSSTSPASITDAIGDGWITDLDQLAQLRPLADDAELSRSVSPRPNAPPRTASRDWLKADHRPRPSIPTRIFDCQIKRIHEYKRQLLNALHIVVLYNRLRENPRSSTLPPRTFFFAGKAAPAYQLGQADHQAHQRPRRDRSTATPQSAGGSKVLFLPNYSVSLAERLIPASDVSEQISTAGYEASGTSNMKFMMNGALTVGTRDGATIEMAEEAGEENFFLFGLTAEQVAESRGWYNPRWHYEQRARDPGRPRPDLLRSLQPERSGAASSRSATRCSRTAITTCTWRT